MKFWIIVLGGTLGLAGLFYWLFARQESQAAQTARLQAPLPVTVAVAPATLRRRAPAGEHLGQTEARREVALTAPTSGQVRQVLVALNQTVRAGQPLLRLDQAAARASLGAARAALAQAQLDQQRQEELLAEKNAPLADVEAARLQTTNARAQVAGLEKQLADAVVRAPIGGTVNEKPVERGQYVQPGAPLLTLLDVGEVKLLVQVPEAELREWRVGRRLPVRFEAYPNLDFTGTVHHLGLKGGEAGRFPVELRIANNCPAAPLRVGLTARVRLTPTDTARQLLVPRTALAAQAPQPTVYVLDAAGRVQRRPVALGPALGNEVAIRAGLRAGERVVTSGTDALRDGLSVRLRPN